MTSTARTAAGLSVLLMPVAFAAGDLLRMYAIASPASDAAGEDELRRTMAEFAAVQAHRGTYELASWLFYAGAVLTIPMVLVLWRLAVDGSRRWAWAGATLGTLFVVGQFAHLLGEFGATLGFAASADPEAARFALEWHSNGFSSAVVAPFVIGIMLAPIVQAIALKRAGVIPLWGMLAVTGASVLLTVVGSTPVTTVVWAVLMVAGLAPAALMAIRGPEHSDTHARDAAAALV